MLVLGTTHTHTYMYICSHVITWANFTRPTRHEDGVPSLHDGPILGHWILNCPFECGGAGGMSSTATSMLIHSASPPAIAWDIDHWSHCSDTLSSPTRILFKVVDFLLFVVYLTRISLPVHPWDRFLCCYVLCQAVSDSESGHNFHSCQVWTMTSCRNWLIVASDFENFPGGSLTEGETQ